MTGKHCQNLMTDPDWISIERGQNLLAGEVLLPRLVVKRSSLEHNIQRMSQYCRHHNVSLAPHAKTTMAPGILKRQLDAGAWGFTVATVTQAHTLRRLGVKRILIANELAEPHAIGWLAGELSKDESFEAFVLVDSLRGVEILHTKLHAYRPSRQLAVLIELGEQGRRAGCRTDEEAITVADAIKRSPHLRLAGIEGFEALVEDDAIRPFLRRMRTLTTLLAKRRYFDSASEVIVSVGSSEHIESTVEEMSGWVLDPPVRTLLRPGGYATNSIMLGYRPSLEILSVIVSRPEPKLAIAGFGRRDVPSDHEGQLTPMAVVSRCEVRNLTDEVRIVRLYDQHAVIALGDAKIEVGEFLQCSVVSPYRPAFATWRTIPLVDDDYRVVEVLAILY